MIPHMDLGRNDVPPTDLATEFLHSLPDFRDKECFQWVLWHSRQMAPGDTTIVGLGRNALPLVEVRRGAFRTGRSDPHNAQYGKLGCPRVNAGQDPYQNAGANNLGTRFARAACHRRTHCGKRAGSPTLSSPCRRRRWPTARLYNVGDPAKIGHHGRPLL
jgi:hypothetical protein